MPSPFEVLGLNWIVIGSVAGIFVTLALTAICFYAFYYAAKERYVARKVNSTADIIVFAIFATVTVAAWAGVLL